MTQKDYELLADVIRPHYDEAVANAAPDSFGVGTTTIENLVEDLCARLEAENPRFHKATFLRRALGKLPSEL